MPPSKITIPIFALAPEEKAQLQRLTQLFQNAWRTGKRPGIEAYLRKGHLRLCTLALIVPLDLQYRWLAGERPLAEFFLDRYPELQANPAVLVRVVAAEYHQRQRLEGPTAALANCLQRFPQHAAALRSCLSSCSVEVVQTPPPTVADPGPAILMQSSPEFEILGVLGQGGMGIVLKARQIRLNRMVALKLLLAGQFATADAQARFRIEAEAAARLSHPNIVHIHQIDQYQGSQFLVLEYIDGPSLAKYLGGRPLDVREAARLAKVLAMAIQAAHDAGVLHRDLKPANILLAKPGVQLPKITDFGLAKCLDQEGSPTRTGTLMGTPGYMAPEQAAGKQDLGPTCDIYALGVILCECLTGRLPFRGQTPAELLHQASSNELISPCELQSQVPRALETICLKCLRRDPGQRYATAQELADDLGRFLRSEPIHARPVTIRERVRRWIGRHPVRATALISMGLILAIGMCGLFWHTQQLGQAWEAARADSQLADANLAEDMENHRYAADLREVHRLINSGDVFSSRELLDRYRHTEGVDRRGFEWDFLDRQLQPPPVRICAHKQRLSLLGYAANGRHLVTASNLGKDSALRVWDSTTGRQTFSAHLTGDWWGTPVALSGDGTTMAGCVENRVRLWYVQTGIEKPIAQLPRSSSLALSHQAGLLAFGSESEVMLWDVPGNRPCGRLTGSARKMVFSPDDRMLAVRSGKNLVVWDVQEKVPRMQQQTFTELDPTTAFAWSASGMLAIANGGTISLWGGSHFVQRRQWPTGLGKVQALAFAPEERFLVLADETGQVVWWDLARGEAIGVRRWQFRPLTHIVFSPDGQTLTVAGEDGNVYSLTAQPPGLFERLGPDMGVAPALAFAPNGKTLVAASTTGGAAVFDAITLRELGRVGHPHQRVSHLSFLPHEPKGANLLLVDATDGRVGFWNFDERKEILNLPGCPEGAPQCLAVSRDGARLAVGSARGVRLWNLRTSSSTLIASNAGVACLAFSPDGKELAGGDSNGTLRFWNLDGSLPPRLTEKNLSDGGALTALTYSPDGDQLVLSHSRLGVQRWKRCQTGELLRQPAQFPENLGGSQLTWSPNGKSLLAFAATSVACWDFRTRRLLWRDQNGNTPGAAYAWHPDGRRVAVALVGGDLEIWDISTWEVRRPVVRRPSGAVRSLAFSPDGRHLLTGTALPLRLLRRPLSVAGVQIGVGDHLLPAPVADALCVWDVQTGKECAGPGLGPGIHASPALLAFSSKGNLVAGAGEDGAIRLWEYPSWKLQREIFASQESLHLAAGIASRTGQPFSPFYQDGVRWLGFSPDGGSLAVLTAKGQFRAWNTTTWEVGPSVVSGGTEEHARTTGLTGCIGVTPGGTLLVVEEGRLLEWDLKCAAKSPVFFQPEAKVVCGAVSSEGRWLALALENGRIQLCDRLSGKATMLIGHQDEVKALAFDPTGRTLASGGADRTVRLWSTAAGREIAVLTGHRRRVWSLAFAKDGATLVSGGEGGEVLVWRGRNRQDLR